MQKVALVAVLVGSSQVLGQVTTTQFSGTWNTPSPNAPTTDCCYYSGPLTIATGATPLASGTSSSTAGGCSNYAAATSNFNAQSLEQTFATITAASTTATSGATTKLSNWAIGNDQVTLTYTPTSPNSATCTQTFKRATAAIPAIEGTWSVVAGTGANAATTCCFLQPGNNLVVSTSGTVTKAVGKYATAQCGANNNLEYSQVLKAGTAPVTATDILGTQQFTVSGNTLTYNPTGVASDCTQILTKVPNSGIHLASVMTPVVVGGAMLGLAI